MLDRVRGEVVERGAHGLRLQVGPVVLAVTVPGRIARALPAAGPATLYTRLDLVFDQKKGRMAPTLYGFATAEERGLFELLMSVSGIGPATALGALDTLSCDELVAAILAGDVARLKRLKGVGPKTAQLLIVFLREKIAAVAAAAPAATGAAPAAPEAAAALITLGYSAGEADRAVARFVEAHPDRAGAPVEALLPALLQWLRT